MTQKKPPLAVIATVGSIIALVGVFAVIASSLGDAAGTSSDGRVLDEPTKARTATASSQPQPATQMAEASPERWYDAPTVAVGERLYAERCATCHGKNAQGGANWRTKGADGKMPPPPLNGTGHTWHHPGGVLMKVILDGSPGGAGNMPAWRNVLSKEQIAALIAYVQSLWSDDIYAEWYKIELRSRKG
jgi:mono/diheme cytochrome c family protein